jgi:hypothetical protein
MRGLGKAEVDHARQIINLEEALPEKYKEAQEALDEARAIGEEYGVRVEGYTTGARNAGRAIVEEAQRLQRVAVRLDRCTRSDERLGSRSCKPRGSCAEERAGQYQRNTL